MCTTDPKKPEHPHSHALTRQAALLLCGMLLALRLDLATADNNSSPAAGPKARNAPEAVAAAAPADDARLRFDIARGNAPERLNEYSTQSGFQVLYMFEDMNGITTNRVRGRLTPREAMEALTRGTRIRYRFVNTKTVTLTALPPPPLPMVVDASEDRKSRASAVEQVTITASPYRNSIAQLGSRLIAVSRVDIDALGAPTVQDVLRTVPQIFGGGPSEDTRIGIEAESNATLGYGVNLRALGAGSTLVLVNGRRLAGSGTRAMFSDVSSVPLSLVDHIDILADGGSVRYGADAAGGVVNFVLKRAPGDLQTDGLFGTATRGSLHEIQLSQLAGIEMPRLDATFAFDYYSRDNLPARDRVLARSDLQPLGGSDFRTYQSNPGTIVIGTRRWRIPSGQDGVDLDASELVPDDHNLADPWSDSDLLPAQKRLTFYASATSNVSDDIRVFVDALYSRRDLKAAGTGATALLTVPPSNAFYVNPKGTNEPIQVGYSFTDDLGPTVLSGETGTLTLSGGAEFDVGAWKISTTVDYAFERARTRQDNALEQGALRKALEDSNPETALNVFGDGSHTNRATLERIRTANLYRADSSTLAVSAVGSTEGAFRDKPFELTAGVEYREQEFESVSSTLSLSDYVDERNNRSVLTGFGAVSLPLGSKVEISLGGRYDHYSDFGSTLSPRFGATWQALGNLTVRANWSESYRPPNLVDTDESENVTFVTTLPDATTTG
ncbi:MAG: TonB-dependent receptor, partial [Steroidobacteraceae bacterium]|nr:TonB-dependent receptor [Steroidobacteraceae bacterium]